MKFITCVLSLASILSLLSCKEQTAPHSKYEVGQVWKYKTKIGEEQSTIVILKIEHYDSMGNVIHTSVRNLKINNSRNPNTFSETINHLPIAEEALDRSVTALVSNNSEIPDFSEGYKYWKEAFDNGAGGVFSIEVKDAVKYTEETFSTDNAVAD